MLFDATDSFGTVLWDRTAFAANTFLSGGSATVGTDGSATRGADSACAIFGSGGANGGAATEELVTACHGRNHAKITEATTSSANTIHNNDLRQKTNRPSGNVLGSGGA